MSDATYLPNNAADTSAPGVRSVFPEPIGVVRPALQIGQIAIKTPEGKRPADGSSRVPVEMEVFDRHGDLLKTPITISLEISADVPVHLFGVDGSPLHDPTGAHEGIQIEVRNGRASLSLQSPGVAGEVVIRAHVASGLPTPSNNAAWTEQKVVFTPDTRSLIAVGLAEARISHETTTAEVRPPPGMRDQYSQDLTHWSTALRSTQRDTTGRTAFFVKGTVAENTLLTASFDSEKDRRARQMQNVSSESLYPIYGDEAEIGFDAVSSSQLYLRIDREANYLLYGDYTTGGSRPSRSALGTRAVDLPSTVLGNYNRVLTGGRAHYQGEVISVNGFIAQDRLRHVVEEYPLNGTSIIPFNSRGTAMQFSERVELVTYDRNNRNRELSRELLVRNQDYTFEPFNGRVFLLGAQASWRLDFDNAVSIPTPNTGGEFGSSIDRLTGVITGPEASLQLSAGEQVGPAGAGVCPPLGSHPAQSVTSLPAAAAVGLTTMRAVSPPGAPMSLL